MLGIFAKVVGLVAVFALLTVVPVWSAQQQVTEQEVREAVMRLVGTTVAGRGWQVGIRRIGMPLTLRVSTGGRELEVTPPGQWDAWGAANMALLVRVNGRLERNVPIRVELESLADMVVAARQLPPGTVLAADDLAVRRQDVAAVQGRFVARTEDALGKKVRTTIRQGMPLRGDLLERVPVIKSGQLVTIVGESDSLRITVTGRARSSGGVGDVIMVQNLTSSKELPAKVLDASHVLIGF